MRLGTLRALAVVVAFAAGTTGTLAQAPKPLTGAIPSLEELDAALSVDARNRPDWRAGQFAFRAFQFSHLRRETESRNDIVEMAKVWPDGWALWLGLNIPSQAFQDRAAALRVLGYGLQIKLGEPWLLYAQAAIYGQLAEFTKVVALLEGVLAGPGTPLLRERAFELRGHANLNLGNYLQASQDFEGAMANLATGSKASIPRMWDLLWRYVAQVHSRPDALTNLEKDIVGIDLEGWPGAVAKFALGKTSAGEFEAAVAAVRNSNRLQTGCVAAYFIGVDAIKRGDRRAAHDQFHLAQTRCSAQSTYGQAAASELKRL